MRIYFNGSFCNGKTSLKNWVSKAYGLKMIPEIARTVLAEREITTKEQLAKLRSDTELLYIIQKEIIERQYNLDLPFSLPIKDYRVLFIHHHYY